jgi:hypothetical protein
MLSCNCKITAGVLAAALLTLNAAAQQHPPDTQKSSPEAPSANNRDRRGEKLGEQLSRNKGVIRPPSGQDSEIIVRPPETQDRTPIIPPPYARGKGTAEPK